MLPVHRKPNFTANKVFMKYRLLLLSFLISGILLAQRDILPNGLTEQEQAMLGWYSFTQPVQPRGLEEPPPYPVRHMAEWEELQALTVTWRSFTGILTQIVYHAAQEVPVVVFCNNQSALNDAQSKLQAAGTDMNNVQLVLAPSNSIWIRDYGANCVYANGTEDLYFVDWVYNRPRPLDDVLPDMAAAHFNLPIYTTTLNPDRMVNTGGNFMSDGMGTAFASRLILEENKPGNAYSAGPHTEEEIDAIMNAYMGIDRFIKMETLPYDGIHHIDMHMKLLDEETLLVGEYPQGTSDGPQIEANLDYVLSNFNSSFGTPYKVVRVIQPPDFSGSFPPGGDYRTYTNSVIVNKTILVPTYEEEFDTIALRVYRENFPGYKVVGIDCNDIIGYSGALHCITKEVGTSDPLLIQHQRKSDITDNEAQGDYEITATIQHKSGIANAQVFFTTDTLQAYQQVDLLLTDPATDTWTGSIPHQPDGSEIFYYIRAQANSTKTQVRPLVAPEGFFRFKVEGNPLSTAEPVNATLAPIYPNPASAVTVIPVNTTKALHARIECMDVLGRTVEVVFDGKLPGGVSKHFIHAENYLPGTYFVTLKTEAGIQTQMLVVK